MAADLQSNAKVVAISIPRPKSAIRNINGDLNYDTSDLTIWNSSLPSSTFEDNASPDFSGSFYPASFDLADTHTEAQELDIYINVDEALLGSNFTISAMHGREANILSRNSASRTLSFSKEGVQSVRVSLDPSWTDKESPWGITGDLFWMLTVISTGQIVPMNPTRLELYAIKYPLASLFKNEIPVKFLRHVVEFSGGQSSVPWAARVADLTISKFGFKYDNKFGGHRYCNGYDGEFFRLDAYLDDINKNGTVNCYDQAGIVQLCLSLSEATSNTVWYFMDPLGYMHTSWLVGWGLTNNPFFGNAPRTNPDQICPNDDERRSFFGNHAFIGINTTDEDVPIAIVDSTVGPYRGRIGLESYLQYTTQGLEDTTRYNDTRRFPGTVMDSEILVGIESLEPGRMFEEEPESIADAARSELGMPESSVTKRWLNVKASRLDTLLQKALVVDAPAVEMSSNVSFARFFASKDVKRHSVEVVQQGTFGEWILDDGATRVEVTVSKDHECAKRCFKNLITAYNNPPDFLEAPKHRQKGHLTLETADSESSGIVAWVHGNIMVRISSDAPKLAHELSDELHALILANSMPISEIAVPENKVYGWPSSPIQAGQKFSVTVSSNTKVHASIRSQKGVSSFVHSFSTLLTNLLENITSQKRRVSKETHIHLPRPQPRQRHRILPLLRPQYPPLLPYNPLYQHSLSLLQPLLHSGVKIRIFFYPDHQLYFTFYCIYFLLLFSLHISSSRTYQIQKSSLYAIDSAPHCLPDHATLN